jgi:hypothetical protein
VAGGVNATGPVGTVGSDGGVEDEIVVVVDVDVPKVVEVDVGALLTVVGGVVVVVGGVVVVVVVVGGVVVVVGGVVGEVEVVADVTAGVKTVPPPHPARVNAAVKLRRGSMRKVMVSIPIFDRLRFRHA